MERARSSVFAAVVFLAGTSLAIADRGGWADPAGGWTFVEEFHKIPDFEPTDKSVWLHDNGSDQYSGNANSQAFAEAGWTGGDVVRVDEVPGAGDTEDGVNRTADATVLTLIDLGDPRTPAGVSDPSDRKFMFTHVFVNPDGSGIETPIISGGITLLVRYRMMPLDLDAPFQADNDWADPPFNFKQRAWVPQQYNKAQICFGYADPVLTDLTTTIGVGYYAANSIFIQGNDPSTADADQGKGNILIKGGIDTTQFHTIWLTAIATEADPYTVNVKAWIDGGAQPAVTSVVLRGPDVVDGPEIDSEAGFADFPQTCIQFGLCATNNYGAMQIDYICANPYKAVEPVAAGVEEWSLY